MLANDSPADSLILCDLGRTVRAMLDDLEGGRGSVRTDNSATSTPTHITGQVSQRPGGVTDSLAYGCLTMAAAEHIDTPVPLM